MEINFSTYSNLELCLSSRAINKALHADQFAACQAEIEKRKTANSWMNPEVLSAGDGGLRFVPLQLSILGLMIVGLLYGSKNPNFHSSFNPLWGAFFLTVAALFLGWRWRQDLKLYKNVTAKKEVLEIVSLDGKVTDLVAYSDIALVSVANLGGKNKVPVCEIVTSSPYSFGKNFKFQLPNVVENSNAHPYVEFLKLNSKNEFKMQSSTES